MSTALSFLKGIGESIAGKTAQFMNKDTAKAMVFVCALVSAADGSVDAAEKKRTAQAFQAHPDLEAYDKPSLIKQYNDACDLLIADFDVHSIDMVAKIGKALKDNEEKAVSIIKFGLLIAKSSEGIAPAEANILKELCTACKVPPAQFGL